MRWIRILGKRVWEGSSLSSFCKDCFRMNVIWGGQGNWENWEKAICEDGPWECWSSFGEMLVYGLIKAYWATKFLSKWYQHMSPKVAYFTTKLELRPIIVVISTSFFVLIFLFLYLRKNYLRKLRFPIKLQSSHMLRWGLCQIILLWFYSIGFAILKLIEGKG